MKKKSANVKTRLAKTAAPETFWTLARVLLATGGHLLSGKAEGVFQNISTDTRNVQAGDLFVALCGEKFDGHDFLVEAVRNGAAGILVSRRPEKEMSAVPVVKVQDTLIALGDLTNYKRMKMKQVRVIAITGSCGKTTVKEMTASILGLKYNILKTKGNFNNLVGLPLSLLPVEGHHDFAVMEMGMNHPGEIARLTEIADPDIACITNVQAAHLEGVGSIEGVAKAKGELFAGIRSSGTLVVNYDDKRVRELASSCRQRKIHFGRSVHADVRALRLSSLGERGMAFTLAIGKQSDRVRIQSLGSHNVSNALAAAGIAHAAGVKFADIVTGLENFRPADKRLQVQEIRGGIKLVNDAYNANPSSMVAALETLQRMDRTHQKIAILGDMFELGEQSVVAHRSVGEAAAKLKFDYVLAVGEFAKTVVESARRGGIEKGRALSFAGKEELTKWLCAEIDKGVIRKGDWLLLKGSRGMRMETVMQALLEKKD